MILIRQAKYDKIKHKIYGDGKMIYDIIIVGAGASGLAAAISAKRTNAKLNIAAVEALPRVGKKILATGNGRCNLTNLNAKSSMYSNSKFVEPVMSKYPPENVIGFFRSVGLMCVSDGEGRVYPMSNTAASVLDALRLEAERLGVEFICEKHIDRVTRKNGIFTLGELSASKIIVCTGGCASPSQGSDGSGYVLLKGLVHRITEVYPALVQLTTEENTKALKGIRAKANVTIKKDGKPIDRSKGEVLFTDYGLSGISVMDISRSVKKGKYDCIIDVLPSCDKVEAEEFLLSLDGGIPAENALSGLLPKKLGQYVLKKSGINFLTPIGSLNRSAVSDVVRTAKGLKFSVSGTMGFKNAQITAGGADVDEFDANTLQSKLVGGLYCAGEILDVDSVCGGFNLQWAWASGICAGRSAAEK